MKAWMGLMAACVVGVSGWARAGVVYSQLGTSGLTFAANYPTVVGEEVNFAPGMTADGPQRLSEMVCGVAVKGLTRTELYRFTFSFYDTVTAGDGTSVFSDYLGGFSLVGEVGENTSSSTAYRAYVLPNLDQLGLPIDFYNDSIGMQFVITDPFGAALSTAVFPLFSTNVATVGSSPVGHYQDLDGIGTAGSGEFSAGEFVGSGNLYLRMTTVGVSASSVPAPMAVSGGGVLMVAAGLRRRR